MFNQLLNKEFPYCITSPICLYIGTISAFLRLFQKSFMTSCSQSIPYYSSDFNSSTVTFDGSHVSTTHFVCCCFQLFSGDILYRYSVILKSYFKFLLFHFLYWLASTISTLHVSHPQNVSVCILCRWYSTCVFSCCQSHYFILDRAYLLSAIFGTQLAHTLPLPHNRYRSFTDHLTFLVYYPIFWILKCDSRSFKGNTILLHCRLNVLYPSTRRSIYPSFCTSSSLVFLQCCSQQFQNFLPLFLH